MSKEIVGKILSKGKAFKKDQLLIIVLSGVLLMIIAWPVKTDNKKASAGNALSTLITEKKSIAFNDTSGISESESTSNDLALEENYIYVMEEKVEKILSSIEQVGKAEVVITLKSSGEKIVEKDMPVTRSNTDEKDSQGGTRIVSSVDSGETTIYETESGKSTPYVVKTTSPQVEGVLVVCEGAGVGAVSKNITDAIEVLFGIEPHKIKVVKMKTS